MILTLVNQSTKQNCQIYKIEESFWNFEKIAEIKTLKEHYGDNDDPKWKEWKKLKVLEDDRMVKSGERKENNILLIYVYKIVQMKYWSYIFFCCFLLQLSDYYSTIIK